MDNNMADRHIGSPGAMGHRVGYYRAIGGETPVALGKSTLFAKDCLANRDFEKLYLQLLLCLSEQKRFTEIKIVVVYHKLYFL